jgi:D-3-phosphoglycerate dehydrogenase
LKILLTSTSFQDTPGKHHDLLKGMNISFDMIRGPVKEKQLLELIQNYDGVICGDDEYTEAVIKKGAENKLKVISKYGVGLDSIDLQAAKKYNVAVTNCPGVNQVSVAEHVFGLLLSFYRNIHLEYNITKKGEWKRLAGHELFGKTIVIVGLGAVGKEVAKRAFAFGMDVKAFDGRYEDEFLKQYSVQKFSKIEEAIKGADIISLHLPLNKNTEGIISKEILFGSVKKGAVIVNTSRAKLIFIENLLEALDKKIISGYLTDVLEEEPMVANHPLLKYENVIITPHIGSRTFESVERQGIMAVKNLKREIKIK